MVASGLKQRCLGRPGDGSLGIVRAETWGALPTSAGWVCTCCSRPEERNHGYHKGPNRPPSLVSGSLPGGQVVSLRFFEAVSYVTWVVLTAVRS